MIYKTLAITAVTLFLFVFVARRIHTTFCVEHTFNASVDRVWAVWNDADSVKKWWGPIIAEFGETGGKTKVTVTEVGMPLFVKILSKIAWAQQFDKIESLL